ncbi:MAG: phytanoyl-CoA dioxygenase [Flavobacterium sp. BFFFF2]|nr:MAG: phytanoyl-CoA dioxygenase [Flavobacterium sp. BFFFF2]
MKQIDELKEGGFAIMNGIYSSVEVEKILSIIENTNSDKDTFRKTNDLFAIRQFLKEVPSISTLVFNDNLVSILAELFGDNYFVVKSLYFDKPALSNWYVSYHQDLTISVDKKREVDGFGFWTKKQDQFSVQPPLDILDNVVTIRIHLDDTDENNGALKVVLKSHNRGIYRPETIDWTAAQEVSCHVQKGGIMLMKPLLLHSSSRTTNNKQRRVIHIEFSSLELPNELNWSERFNLT